MAIDYDPFSDAAMRDPHSLYTEMRKEGAPHFIEKYNAWALTLFRDVYDASLLHEKDVTFTVGQPLNNVLLNEPFPHAFPSMDGLEHRKWRGVVRNEYNPGPVASHEKRIRALARELLAPLLKKDEFDVYSEYFNKLFAINAGYNLGFEPEESIRWRGLLNETMHREKGQVGALSERNVNAGTQLTTELLERIKMLREHPEKAGGHTAAYMNAEIDGKRLSDQEVAEVLTVFISVGSGTTPNVCTGTVYYLDQHPDQKAAVLADLSLVEKAFFETARYDQPTNMLCRRAVNDFELGGKQIKAGQNLLYIYASANRDENEFENADKFDIFREYRRDMTYGLGGHKCLGMHLATFAGGIALTELFSAVKDYEVINEQCERAYGEFLSGFIKVPIRIKLA